MYKYMELAESIREEIYGGRYKPGEKLPSVRSYQSRAGYHPDTVMKAFRLLEKEHLLYAVPQSGYYVVKSISGTDIKKIDLRTVHPPYSINPYKDFYHCMEKSIEIYERKLFEYIHPQGMEELRTALVSHLMSSCIFTREQDIFITNGAQQALYILSAMPFCGCGNKVVVEQPTYFVMLQALRCNHIPVVGIKRTEQGIDLEELETVFKERNIKFFYLIPRFHNPTGFSYTREQKQKILRLAQQYGVYIVEDDYLADLEIDKKEDSLYAMGDKKRIIYIRSFSKTLLPGLRLGMLLLPEQLQRDFLIYKKSIDLNTPVLTQGALEIYLKSSMYRIHAKRIKSYYKHKMEVLKKACERFLPDVVRYYIPLTGLYALIETGGKPSERAAEWLESKGVIVSSIKKCFLEGYPAWEGICLCVCNSSDEELVRAAEKIGEYLTGVLQF